MNQQMSAGIDCIGDLVIRLSLLAYSGLLFTIAWSLMCMNEKAKNYAPDMALGPAMFVTGARILLFVSWAPYVLEEGAS